MPAKPDNKAPASTQEEIEARFWKLIPAVNAGDERAAKALHDCCRVVPALWDQLSGMEHNALDSWKKLLAPAATNRDAFTRDSIEAELSRQRKALHVDGDSHLDTLLINRILSAWLQVTHADAAYAQMLQRGGTFKEGEYHQKRLDCAQRQLVRAIQALATVRRLLRPTQVNIGQNQINVAQ
jgi:hypothetical protein